MFRGLNVTTPILCLILFPGLVFATPTRTIYLNDSDLANIAVEVGFSTLLKFDSHPEPGLIGDQDGFKVEYLKNIVAIKPLTSRGQTNLFVFTKDGQFGFRLVASRGRHDNVVFVKPAKNRGPAGPTTVKTTVEIDDLLTKKIGKVARVGDFEISVVSVATPRSKSTIILKAVVRQTIKAKGSKPESVSVDSFTITQSARNAKIENAFFEQELLKDEIRTSALILIRASDLKRGEQVKFVFKPRGSQKNASAQVIFNADL